jgi:hypothetical protein
MSLDDGNPDTLAMAAMTSAFMVGDSESSVELADKESRSTQIHFAHGAAVAKSIELLACRRKRSRALNAPIA